MISMTRKAALSVLLVLAAAAAQAGDDTAARATDSNTTIIAKGPYLQALTTTGVTVMWEANKVSPATLEYGPTGAFGRIVSVESPQNLRKVRLEGLAPDSRYYYRVTQGDAWSPTYSFKTLPESGPFTFVAYGDTRTNADDHFLVASLIAGCHPDFVLHTGDLVSDGNNPKDWNRQFFTPAGPFMARYCLFTAIGNHEHESPLYYKYFGAPSGKPWYSFDCCNAHFIILDSCVDIEPGSQQYKWLVDDLSSTQKTWRFAAFHHPPYSSGPHRSSVWLRNIVQPVFARYGVDIVFNGHDHTYERTYPVISAFSKVHPVTYIVTGGGGAPRYKAAGDFFTAAKLSDLNYCLVSVNANTLKLRAYNGKGKEFDSFSIVKMGNAYANNYLAKTAPMELADVEGATEEAIGYRRLGYPTSARQETIEFEFAAPKWGSLGLELNWKQPETGNEVHPASAFVDIDQGRTAKVSFTFDIAAEDISRPSLEIRGTTSLGDFSSQRRPIGFERKPKPKKD